MLSSLHIFWTCTHSWTTQPNNWLVYLLTLPFWASSNWKKFMFWIDILPWHQCAFLLQELHRSPSIECSTLGKSQKIYIFIISFFPTNNDFLLECQYIKFNFLTSLVEIVYGQIVFALHDHFFLFILWIGNVYPCFLMFNNWFLIFFFDKHFWK